MTSLIKLLRPHQYIKNFFIFLPLFFALKVTQGDLLLTALIAFVAFSLTASAVYVFNDYLDIEDDRLHPKKRFRPLASGEVSKSQAKFLMAGLALAGLSLMAWVDLMAFYVLLFYVVLNLAYTLRLKHVAILDVTIIATGFVLRLFVGSFVTGVALSMWIVVMTFLLALFLALAKRRDDVLIYLETGQKMRKVIDGYNLKFLDSAMIMMASVVIVAYTLYTISQDVTSRLHSEYLYLTVIFVILGIMRYMQIAFVEEDSGSPTRLMLKDRFLFSIVVGWLITFFWIIY
jgi:4-hydroxybenzoate polyprenyltransferase